MNTIQIQILKVLFMNANLCHSTLHIFICICIHVIWTKCKHMCSVDGWMDGFKRSQFWFAQTWYSALARDRRQSSLYQNRTTKDVLLGKMMAGLLSLFFSLFFVLWKVYYSFIKHVVTHCPSYIHKQSVNRLQCALYGSFSYKLTACTINLLKLISLCSQAVLVQY